ncbi:hypothetical protein LSTR_LSTR013056 [Laodelphax striatellus]|uniref:Uncharacterized protein n=1 Tax=Laodelphax striatellus TaxID=195883 RepID=A0A482XCW3_LAOST|nr:hypothetical protein LSTR_LSTR013056 [Laodelphax striatellus]
MKMKSVFFILFAIVAMVVLSMAEETIDGTEQSAVRVARQRPHHRPPHHRPPHHRPPHDNFGGGYGGGGYGGNGGYGGYGRDPY